MEVRSMDVQEFRDTGHRMVDLLADYLERIEDRPLFPDVAPQRLTELFDEPLPEAPAAADEVLRELSRKLLPNCTHVNHPGYFGLITPSPNPMGILGDFLASALNQNLGTYTVGPAAIAMERRTVRWLNDLVGYDERAGGNLTSGGTMANFVGVKLARDWASGDRAQHGGVRQRLAIYTSEERHVAVDKAVDAVGAGREALRVLPTDDEFRIRIDALEEAIARDKSAGIQPTCILGISGTTNTGSLDPLPQLRSIADRERMWLHVDAAYGGGMLLSRKWPGLLDDLKLADSVTIDPHKWFYAPLDAGAILVRDASRLTASFGMRPPYLTDEMDAAGERYQYFVHSFEQSRRFRGLKVWMSFKRYGAEQIGRWIDRNVEQAKHLHGLCRDHPEFHPVMRPPMSAICIRYDPGGIPADDLARIHHEVARRIEAGGRFWISTTLLKGRWWFRINPVNIRTRLSHMDELMALLKHECGQVAGTVTAR
jgi:glutamate/tyrosine decarboxylase-like PLP-dependent enzyme